MTVPDAGEKVRLGGSPVAVSPLGLGCNSFGVDVEYPVAERIVTAALDCGIDLFDTADIYGRFHGRDDGEMGRSEEYLGRALVGRRDQVVIATKFGVDMGDGYQGPRGGAEYARRALQASLRRLRTDRVDILYYHLPDGLTPIGDTLAALGQLIDEGLIRAVGICNVAAELLIEADDWSREHEATRFVAAQDHFNLLRSTARARGAMAVCADREIAFIPYFPLADGLLTGKYRRGEKPPPGSRLNWKDVGADGRVFDRLEALERFARERDHSLLELAIGGLLSQPEVACVIGGATTPEQVRSNALSAQWRLGEGDLEELAELGPTLDLG